MKNVVKLINNSSSVAILGHVSVDQDCLGSAMALKLALEKLGKNVDVFVGDDSYDECMDFLCDKSYFKKELNSANYDLLISVDCATANMLGIYCQIFEAFENTLTIDHHKSNQLYGKYNYIKYESSCCEIIYDIIKKLNVDIDDKIALPIYAGIIADTQCLSIDTITSNTFKILSEIFKINFDFSYVLDKICRVKKMSDIKLQTFVYENFKIKNDVAYLLVKNKDINKIVDKNSGVTFSCGDYVNSLLNIDGVKIAFVISQIEKNNYKVSFRCKKKYDVNKIAGIIGGGGHKQASGAKFLGNPDIMINKIINESIQQIKEVDNV